MKDVDAEIDAIKTILTTLKSLNEEARESVMNYVTQRLNLKVSDRSGSDENGDKTDKLKSITIKKDAVPHIKDLKDEKQPGSHVDRAILVASDLSELAEKGKRKEAVTAQDLDTYFKIANYPKPAAFKDVLKSAKNAGYMDSPDRGKYKLNAVGYNLAVHTLPRNKAKSS
jgi:hypothetical protein